MDTCAYCGAVIIRAEGPGWWISANPADVAAWLCQAAGAANDWRHEPGID